MAVAEVGTYLSTQSTEENVLPIKEARMELTKDMLEVTIPVSGLPSELKVPISNPDIYKIKYIRLRN